ncbi:hypothetical protein [Cellulomonas massiliensis]|uniref:hypothetical protein n=1 Tax=Cellulomonas massiliensis TaxID=1465811 RepID=UPI00037D54FF|nr:hypothetical protein [Cellulomonas massiliensis]
MRFIGLEPLASDVGIIELETDDFGYVDLYNYADLRSVCVDYEQRALELVFALPDSRTLVLRFEQISRWSVSSDGYAFTDMRHNEFNFLSAPPPPVGDVSYELGVDLVDTSFLFDAEVVRVFAPTENQRR